MWYANEWAEKTAEIMIKIVWKVICCISESENDKWDWSTKHCVHILANS